MWFCASSEIARRANGGRFHLCPVLCYVFLQCVLYDWSAADKPPLCLVPVHQLNEINRKIDRHILATGIHPLTSNLPQTLRLRLFKAGAIDKVMLYDSHWHKPNPLFCTDTL